MSMGDLNSDPTFVAMTIDKPAGSALIVAGDLNTDLGEVEGDRWGTEIAAAVTEA